MTGLAVAALLACAAPARAQAPSQVPGEPLSQDAVFPQRPRPPRQQPAPLALALELSFGATFWTKVQVSTAGAVADLSQLVHDGFYKRELIELLVIGSASGRPLKEVVERRRKGAKLASIARGYGLDPDELARAVDEVEAVLDRDYLPRFPGRKPRRERED